VNKDHVVAGTSAASTTALLATVISHFGGVSGDVASAEAGLAVLVFGALIGIAQNLWPKIFKSGDSAS
jgi:hypothetical protein